MMEAALKSSALGEGSYPDSNAVLADLALRRSVGLHTFCPLVEVASVSVRPHRCGRGSAIGQMHTGPDSCILGRSGPFLTVR